MPCGTVAQLAHFGEHAGCGRMVSTARPNSAAGCMECVAIAGNLGIAARTCKRILSKFTNPYPVISPVKYGVFVANRT